MTPRPETTGRLGIHEIMTARFPGEGDVFFDGLRVLVLLPFLAVGETEEGTWALWCVPATQRHEECIHALYHRPPDSPEEEARREAGDPNWGPPVLAMLDEMVRVAFITPRNRFQPVVADEPAPSAAGAPTDGHAPPSPSSTPFHAHLDACHRCASQPFDLCSIGAQLLTQSVTA